ncbi:T9SS type A sorting domain-containing protein, partial [bacterium]|nr:T9SS type A sorting domain-containing protein [bacterium]
ISNSDNLIVYPVPATNDLFFKLNASEQKISYSIYDIAGKLVRSCTQQSISQNHQIDISNIPCGYYTIRLSSKNNVFTTRFIKKNE